MSDIVGLNIVNLIGIIFLVVMLLKWLVEKYVDCKFIEVVVIVEYVFY